MVRLQRRKYIIHDPLLSRVNAIILMLKRHLRVLICITLGFGFYWRKWALGLAYGVWSIGSFAESSLVLIGVCLLRWWAVSERAWARHALLFVSLIKNRYSTVDAQTSSVLRWSCFIAISSNWSSLRPLSGWRFAVSRVINALGHQLVLCRTRRFLIRATWPTLPRPLVEVGSLLIRRAVTTFVFFLHRIIMN